MINDADPHGPAMGMAMCNCLLELGTVGGQQFLDGVVTIQTQSPVVSFAGVYTAGGPNVYAAQSGGTTFILVGPTPSLLAATRLWAGYTLLARPLNSRIRNPFVQQIATDIIAQFGPNHFANPFRVLLAGYSLGGAVCFELNYQIKQAWAVVPNIWTAGAPRPGGRMISDAAPAFHVRRYMAPGDPIPLIPPRLVDLPQAPNIFGILNLLGFEWFVHPAGGLLLSATGATPNNGEVPPTATVVSVTAFPAFLLGQVTGVNTPHALTNYLNLFTLWNNTIGLRPPANPAGARAEQVVVVGRNLVQQAERKAAQAIFAQGVAQDAPALVIPPALAFKAQRNGLIWNVLLGGNIVAIGPRKKKARALANAGNAMLKRLSRQAVVDPVSIVAQFSQYIADAQNPVSGIVPQINVRVPPAP